MKLRETIVSIFKKGDDTLSCKRVCGFVGWMVILYCAIMEKTVAYMDVLIGADVVLLGVETVMNPFVKKEEQYVGDKDRQSVEA